MKCAAPRMNGRIVVGICDGEVDIRGAGTYCEAACTRCYNVYSSARLLAVIDEQTEALERAEAKVARLYARGADTTSALRDEKAALGNLAELSMAVVQDGDDENARLVAALVSARGEITRMATDGGGFSCTVIDDIDEALAWVSARKKAAVQP